MQIAAVSRKRERWGGGRGEQTNKQSTYLIGHLVERRLQAMNVPGLQCLVGIYSANR
jgi:hypothetical protein